MFERVLDKIKVVYHLPNKSGNFGWDVNGNTIFVFPNGKFPKHFHKRNILKGSSKFRTGKSKRKGSYHQLLSRICGCSAKFQAARVYFEKKRSTPNFVQNFHSEFLLTICLNYNPTGFSVYMVNNLGFTQTYFGIGIRYKHSLCHI